jgi:hypothetical protein
MSTSPKSPSPRESARERAAAGRAAVQQAERRRRIRWLAIVAGVLVVVAAVIVIAVTAGGSSTPQATPSPTPSSGGHSTATLGPEAIPIESGQPLASAAGAAAGEPVDGIKCEASEQVAYHIHAHLAIFVDGRLRPVPIGIGIVKPVVQQTPQGGFAGASQCYYWLHVHAQDGVIHIESPTQQTYTLGNFFNIWQQPLTSTRVATASGPVTAYVNGKPFAGDPNTIPLTAHATIQLDIGSPAVAPQPVDWSKSTL